jgi:hypothetical protein
MASERWYDTDQISHRLAQAVFRDFPKGVASDCFSPTLPTDNEQNSNGPEGITSPMNVGGTVEGGRCHCRTDMAYVLIVFFVCQPDDSERNSLSR